ncbi:MAG: 5-(carboxyamino)imidazole ribonucleotide synthase [Planctomycetia bacterium]|nr:5-(carboxyamino)imidazole ribonucleotide synthase [Planctomycetia bacterium]
MNIGILGGGQLGRMLGLAGYPLGFRFRCFDTTPDAVAGHVMPLTVGSFDDLEALQAFAEGLDVLTYEFENVPTWAVEFLATHVNVHPSPLALSISQDRIEEKTFFQSMGVPTALFLPVNTREELDTAVDQLGMPCVIKTCRLGYDGKGQFVIRSRDDAEAAWQTLQGNPLILEQYVTFDRELSIIAVRSTTGDKKFYSLVQNFHEGGILRKTLAPASNVSAALQQQAEDFADMAMHGLEYSGVLAIEFFQVGEKLVVNEMAPRVHNSGHWTIEGACTSQFENHLRAICGLPLGNTRVQGSVGMINLIGSVPALEKIMSEPCCQNEKVSIHLYGKEPKPGRKIGHVTIVSAHDEKRDEIMRQIG